MKNKKGLSTIVATLIIILLVLVATGIIWVVVRNVIQGGSEDVEINAKCLDSQVVATQTTRTEFGNPAVQYSNNTVKVTLERLGGNDEIGGVNIVFTDIDEQSNFIYPVEGNLQRMGITTKEVQIPLNEVDFANLGYLPKNATKVTVVVYFLDSSGKAVYCPSTNALQF